MRLTDYVTPSRVAWAVGLGFLTWVVLFLVKTYTSTVSASLDVWGLFMDLVTVLSLLITVAILSDLKRIQDKYLFQATAPSLHERLKEKADMLAETLRDSDPPRHRASETAGRAEAVLKEIEEVVRDEEVKSRVSNIRDSIDRFRTRTNPEVDEYDILGELRQVEEYLIGLMERSKWRQ